MSIEARGAKGAWKVWLGRNAKRGFALLGLVAVGILLTQACLGDRGSAEGDRAAMVALYHSTDGGVANCVFSNFSPERSKEIFSRDDTHLEQWETFLQNIDALTEGWEGFVETDGRGRITFLNLGRNSWVNLGGSAFGHFLGRASLVHYCGGEIPPELGNLSKLEGLYIDGEGEIPPELGKLSRLETLDLVGIRGGLTGAIPSELGNLGNLRELYLQRTGLTGEIPPELGKLSNLRELHLYDNELSGEIPPELGNLSNLRELWLHDNELTGEIPSELGDLSNLRELSLRDNELTGEIPSELGDLSNLVKLSLSHNNLTGEIPRELGDLSNLRQLWLYNNRLTGCAPEGLPYRSWNSRSIDLPFCEAP